MKINSPILQPSRVEGETKINQGETIPNNNKVRSSQVTVNNSSKMKTRNITTNFTTPPLNSLSTADVTVNDLFQPATVKKLHHNLTPLLIHKVNQRSSHT